MVGNKEGKASKSVRMWELNIEVGESRWSERDSFITLVKGRHIRRDQDGNNVMRRDKR